MRQAAAAQATRYGWFVVGMGALVFMTNYTDKTLMSVVAPHMMTSLHLSKLAMGGDLLGFRHHLHNLAAAAGVGR